VQGMNDWVQACEDLAEGTLRGMAIESFKYILQGTPEWSGNLVAGWRLNIGVQSSGYAPSIFKERSPSGSVGDEPFSKLRPNAAALQYATALAKDSIPLIRLNGSVHITNDTPYADMVENNTNRKGSPFLRGVNLPVEMVSAAYDRANRQYRYITESQAHRLAGATL